MQFPGWRIEAGLRPPFLPAFESDVQIYIVPICNTSTGETLSGVAIAACQDLMGAAATGASVLCFVVSPQQSTCQKFILFNFNENYYFIL